MLFALADARIRNRFQDHPPEGPCPRHRTYRHSTLSHSSENAATPNAWPPQTARLRGIGFPAPDVDYPLVQATASKPDQTAAHHSSRSPWSKATPAHAPLQTLPRTRFNRVARGPSIKAAFEKLIRPSGFYPSPSSHLFGKTVRHACPRRCSISQLCTRLSEASRRPVVKATDRYHGLGTAATRHQGSTAGARTRTVLPLGGR